MPCENSEFAKFLFKCIENKFKLRSDKLLVLFHFCLDAVKVLEVADVAELVDLIVAYILHTEDLFDLCDISL